MMRLAGILAALALPAVAGPESSIRPLARGAVLTAVVLAPDVRPALRPQSEQEVAMAKVTYASVPLPMSRRPILRPDGLEQRVMSKRRAQKRGSVCGDVSIQGEKIGSVPGRLRGCGVKNAVRITSVSGVKLSTASTMDCGTAQALKSWIDTGLAPAMRPVGTVAQIKVAAHYACRTRNNKTGAKISEHGKGRAIDISGFTLTSGSTVTVLRDWNKGAAGTALRKMHKAACGPFGTVLGPEADRFHRDHFHFDTARYRSGSYCR